MSQFLRTAHARTARRTQFLLTLSVLGGLTLVACQNNPAALQPLTQVLNLAPAINAGAEVLPVNVPVNHQNLFYSGRWDWTETSAPKCAWPATAVALRFRGTDVNVSLDESGSDYWQFELDGAPLGKLKTVKGEGVYRLASDLEPGIHTVRLVKATEAFVGSTKFKGFQLNTGAEILPLEKPKRRLEVIGDSISAGYGNEAPNKETKFSADTENAYFTYGAMAARQWGADYTCIAWSGKKMWPDNTIPELYDRIIPQDATSQWDFNKSPADAVLINLATNDFARVDPEEAGWTEAYKQFIARVRKNYPNARIYCAIGPMMGNWGGRTQLTTLRSYLTKVVTDVNAAGDTKVSIIDFGQQKAENGYGADWHPNIKTNTLMADQLLAQLKADFPEPVPAG